MSWLVDRLSSSIGKKFIMAITGLSLLAFLAIHLANNLLLFLGPEIFNENVERLEAIKPLVRVIELVLLLIFAFHIFNAFKLYFENKKAKPEKYAINASSKNSTFYSRYMTVTGTIILVFLIFHLSTFWRSFNFGAHPANDPHPFYTIIQEAFANPLISIFYIIIYFRKSLFAKDVKSEVLGSFNEKRIISDKKLLIKSLIVFVIVIVLFATHGLHHMQIGAIALGGGFLLSLVARQNPDEILKDVEWSTLFFFAGLFIVLGAVEKTGIIVSFSNMLIDISGNNEQLLSLLLTPFSALSASFLSAVPYTAAMINVVAALQESLKSHDAVLWWALSLGACFGANGTIMGSAANLIALDIARKNKISIDYWRYIKFSFPLMLITVAGATFYIFVRYGR